MHQLPVFQASALSVVFPFHERQCFKRFKSPLGQFLSCFLNLLLHFCSLSTVFQWPAISVLVIVLCFRPSVASWVENKFNIQFLISSFPHVRLIHHSQGKRKKIENHYFIDKSKVRSLLSMSDSTREKYSWPPPSWWHYSHKTENMTVLYHGRVDMTAVCVAVMMCQEWKLIIVHYQVNTPQAHSAKHCLGFSM